MKHNLAYMRCCADTQGKSTPALFSVATPTTNLQALEWADAFKTGKVTISDIALAASVFGQASTASTTAAYFANPLYSSAPASGTVTIGDIAVAASYFDHGITAPFLGTSTTPFGQAAPPGFVQYTPNVDPRTVLTTTTTGAQAILYFGGVYLNGTRTMIYFQDTVNPPAATSVQVYLDGGTTVLQIPGDTDSLHTLVCNLPWGPTIDISACIPAGTPVNGIDVAVTLVNGKQILQADAFTTSA
jgi:hypothetical protein